jgi:hypothetical protein
VTGQALGVNLFGRVLRWIVDLGHVAAAGHVLRPGTMAAFTTLVRGTALFIERGLPVRGFLPGLVNFLVTGLAGLGSYILGRLGERRTGGGSRRRW